MRVMLLYPDKIPLRPLLHPHILVKGRGNIILFSQRLQIPRRDQNRQCVSLTLSNLCPNLCVALSPVLSTIINQ